MMWLLRNLIRLGMNSSLISLATSKGNPQPIPTMDIESSGAIEKQPKSENIFNIISVASSNVGILKKIQAKLTIEKVKTILIALDSVN